MGESASFSGKDVIYDDSAFEMFVASILTLVVVPVLILRGIRLIRGRSVEENIEVQRMKEYCACEQCQLKKSRLQKHQWNQEKSQRLAVNVCVIVGVFVLVWMGVRIVSRSESEKDAHFDPFEVLQVSASASKAEIKSAYRRQSLVYHPDKQQHGRDKRAQKEAEKQFVRIAKAYKTLTDDAAMENYRKYGNPDGYRGSSYGIALPKAMAEHAQVMLVVYLLGLVLVLPVCVGVWWRSQSKKMSNSVLTSTYRMYIFTLSRTHLVKNLLIAYTASFEFVGTFRKEYVPGLVQLSQAMKRAEVFDLRKVKYAFPSEDWMTLGLIVLNAHIHRVEIPAELRAVLDNLLLHLPVLGTALIDSVAAIPPNPSAFQIYNQSARASLGSILHCVKLVQMLCQAVTEKDSALMQIPHFTDAQLKYCNSRKNNVFSVYEFHALPAESRNAILKTLTPQQILDVNAFCVRYPLATLNVSPAYVDDERDQQVHQGDTAKLDIDLVLARDQGSAYTPCTWRLPFHKDEVWWVVLADEKRDVVLGLKRLLPADGVAIEATESGRNVQTKYTVSFAFVAPAEGKYDLSVYALCDTYVGCNRYSAFKLDVLPSVDAAEDVKYFESDDESIDESESGDEDERNENAESECTKEEDKNGGDEGSVNDSGRSKMSFLPKEDVYSSSEEEESVINENDDEE